MDNSQKEFFQKITPVIKGVTYSIPLPSLSPKERECRRLAYRNERILYKRKSSLSGNNIISFFNEDSPFKVFSHDEWWSDKWDPMKFGKNYNFSKSFFDQFHDLQLNVPRPPLVNNKAENSDYCNFADQNKDCYLVTSANRNQSSFYGFLLVDNKDAVDCIWCSNCELVYGCIDVRNCYNLKFSQNCSNCRDSSFLINCQSANNCLFCINLRNKQYYIFNKPASKEEYEKFLNYINGSYLRYEEAKARFEEFKEQFPIRKANNFVNSQNVIGENIFNSKNIYFGFDVYESEDCAYLHDGLKAKDCMDICFFDGTELCYESTSLIGYGYRFTCYCRDSYNLFYCDNCHSCKNCFGCSGLRNKEYCILNKQYSRDEWEELVSRIINHMSLNKEWGEFFPIKFSIFPYNNTLSYDYFPIEKEEALKNGWKWMEDNSRNASEEFNSQMPDNINDVDNDICNKVFLCEKTKKPYKIIVQELEFYRKMKLPLPRKCPDQRNKERMKLRNPRDLWDRKCEKCGIDIKTSYNSYGHSAALRVYCEGCYYDTIY